MDLTKVKMNCKECGMEMDISKNVKHKEKYTCNNKVLFLTSCECPECSTRHFLQIDDIYTIKTLNSLKKAYRSLWKDRSNLVLRNKYNRLLDRLTLKRRDLLLRYQDLVVKDSDGRTFQLKF